MPSSMATSGTPRTLDQGGSGLHLPLRLAEMHELVRAKVEDSGGGLRI